jgi:hypothetical protein
MPYYAIQHHVIKYHFSVPFSLKDGEEATFEQFTTEDARIKLKRLFQKIKSDEVAVALVSSACYVYNFALRFVKNIYTKNVQFHRSR